MKGSYNEETEKELGRRSIATTHKGRRGVKVALGGEETWTEGFGPHAG